MKSQSLKRWAGFFAGALLSIALVAVAGCGGSDAAENTPQPAAGGNTAKSFLPLAQSALSTMAPDAKLLVVQTAQSVTETGTPVWAYLFGSPSKDLTFAVYVADGKIMQAGEYSQGGLTKEQWDEIPAVTEWKIDSDKALEAALAAANADTKTYNMGMQTWVPNAESTTQTAEALTWYIYLGEETSAPVQVDARTGKVTSK